MKEFLVSIFGEGENLSPAHMAARAVIMSFVALILIRFSGRRSFGMRSASDNIVVILLGSVLSRAVTGASPFLSTITAGLVIALLHRSVAWFCTLSPAFENLLKGKSRVLYRDGTLMKDNMRRALITEHDLVEVVRSHTGVSDLSEVAEARMERNGSISIQRKK